MIALKAFDSGKRRPINLFFAEIIIALLFFSISGAVILQVFSKADLRSRKSAELERVILFAQTFAEAYSQSGEADKAAELAAKTGGSYEEPDRYVMYLEDGKVRMEAREQRGVSDSGTLSRLDMSFFSGDEELYSLSCSAYIPSGGGADG